MRVDVLHEGALPPEVLLANEDFLAININALILIILELRSLREDGIGDEINDALLARFPLRVHT